MGARQCRTNSTQSECLCVSSAGGPVRPNPGWRGVSWWGPATGVLPARRADSSRALVCAVTQSALSHAPPAVARYCVAFAAIKPPALLPFTVSGSPNTGSSGRRRTPSQKTTRSTGSCWTPMRALAATNAANPSSRGRSGRRRTSRRFRTTTVSLAQACSLCHAHSCSPVCLLLKTHTHTARDAACNAVQDTLVAWLRCSSLCAQCSGLLLTLADVPSPAARCVFLLLVPHRVAGCLQQGAEDRQGPTQAPHHTPTADCGAACGSTRR